MLAYQARPRVFKFRNAPGQELTFPAAGEVSFEFRPLQAFGMEAGGGRTAVRAVPATAMLNQHTGMGTIESESPLSPLKVAIPDETYTVSLDGNVLRVLGQFTTIEALYGLVEGVYFAYPALLNVKFSDPPHVVRVHGHVASIPFEWEFHELLFSWRTTTQQAQEEFASQAWGLLQVVGDGRQRRTLAALHYFHCACRLARSGATAFEFLPEVVTNLAKTLEALFPGRSGERACDAARSGLTQLGFDRDEIEGCYIPAVLLRNQVDAAHVDLSLFAPPDLEVLHAYTNHAEECFRELLQRILVATQAGKCVVPPYDSAEPRSEALRTIQCLREYLARLSTPSDATDSSARRPPTPRERPTEDGPI